MSDPRLYCCPWTFWEGGCDRTGSCRALEAEAQGLSPAAAGTTAEEAADAEAAAALEAAAEEGLDPEERARRATVAKVGRSIPLPPSC